MTLLRVNFRGTVFVPLDHWLLSLAKEPVKLSASDWSRILSFPQICKHFFLDTYRSILQNSCEAPMPRREKTNLGWGGLDAHRQYRNAAAQANNTIYK